MRQPCLYVTTRFQQERSPQWHDFSRSKVIRLVALAYGAAARKVVQRLVPLILLLFKSPQSGAALITRRSSHPASKFTSISQERLIQKFANVRRIFFFFPLRHKHDYNYI
eukprot:SAG31_NODE_2467_length_5652_cov_3.221862_3_plen_110_part_00